MWSITLSKFNLITLFVTLMLTSMINVAYATDIKIGVVNASRILQNSPQAESAREKIQREFSPRDRELIEKQKKLKAMEDKLSKDGAIMSESERSNLEREIVQLKRDIKRSQTEFREDLNFRRNEEFGEIQNTILKAVETVAKEKGYDLVLGDGVIYGSDKVDISDQVIEYLQKEHNSGGN